MIAGLLFTRLGATALGADTRPAVLLLAVGALARKRLSVVTRYRPREPARRWGHRGRPVPGDRDDEDLEVTVQEDGTDEAKSARTIGVLDARGTVAVRDGGLLLRGERGSRGTARLFARDGRPTLMVDVTMPNQSRTTARLRPGP